MRRPPLHCHPPRRAPESPCGPSVRGSHGKRTSGKCSSAEPSWHMTNQTHQHLVLKNFKVKMIFKIQYNEHQPAFYLDSLIVLIHSHLSIYMLLKHWNVVVGIMTLSLCLLRTRTFSYITHIITFKKFHTGTVILYNRIHIQDFPLVQ